MTAAIGGAGSGRRTGAVAGHRGDAGERDHRAAPPASRRLARRPRRGGEPLDVDEVVVGDVDRQHRHEAAGQHRHEQEHRPHQRGTAADQRGQRRHHEHDAAGHDPDDESLVGSGREGPGDRGGHRRGERRPADDRGQVQRVGIPEQGVRRRAGEGRRGDGAKPGEAPDGEHPDQGRPQEDEHDRRTQVGRPGRTGEPAGQHGRRGRDGEPADRERARLAVVRTPRGGAGPARRALGAGRRHQDRARCRCRRRPGRDPVAGPRRCA